MADTATSSRKAHWDEVYRTKAADQVSWYQQCPNASLRALERARLPSTAAVIDIGGGASTLVDELLERGWSDLTVLDVSEAALRTVRSRLGSRAREVDWVAADVTEWTPHRSYDVWHDRAVFHFLVSEADRHSYHEALGSGTKRGSIVVIATFAPDGPERCSGLPVQRYAPEALASELGPDFELLDSWSEDHRTPAGALQSFNWCIARRVR